MMFYEIPREIFKQRLNNLDNFTLIDLSRESSPLKSLGDQVINKSYHNGLADEIMAEYVDKKKNFLICSFDQEDHAPKVLGKKMADVGYHYVYYYLGNLKQDELIVD